MIQADIVYTETYDSDDSDDSDDSAETQMIQVNCLKNIQQNFLNFLISKNLEKRGAATVLF